MNPIHPTQKPQEQSEAISLLLEHYGYTFADEAGVRLRNSPAPLFQLLLLATLLSARIQAEHAVSAAASLFSSGLTTPSKVAQASWQTRVEAITWTGYRRFDERTATTLGQSAERVLKLYQGDLRQLRQAAAGDVQRMHEELQRFKGIGKTGADIFLREVQGVWLEVYPYADERVGRAARALGLPPEPRALSKLVRKRDFPRFAAALIRVHLAGDPATVLAHARHVA